MTVVLKPLGIEPVGRQAQGTDLGGWRKSLERYVVNGQQNTRAARFHALGKVHRCKACLPVVAMNDIWQPAVHTFHGNARRHPAKGRKPGRIVRPVMARGVQIRRSVTLKQVRGVKDQKVLPLRLSCHNTSSGTK